MRYLTGEELRKTLGWWLVLSLFAVGVAVTYLRTLESSPHGTVASKINATYDYVIVGGGAVGCALASRLSEDPRRSVLLLEAGGEENFNLWTHIPLWTPLGWGSSADKGLRTVSQKYACRSQEKQKCTWKEARILGGSSISGRMLYSRGSQDDFASWASDEEETWAFKNVLPYFLKSEDVLIDDLKLSDYHSSSGPMPVSGVGPEVSELHEMFIDAGRELKYKAIDCNGREHIGFCRLQSTLRDGERFSSAKDFLRPVMSRSNLHVSTHSIAIKVILSKTKAVGVEYVRNGKKYNVGATREVVLAAGAVGTPQLLLLSGIGPQEHLEKIGIKVAADLPVGLHLQDHMMYTMHIHTNESVGITKDEAFNLLSYVKYFMLGKGVLSSAEGIFGNALLKTDITSKQGVPDVQLIFSALTEDLSEKKDTIIGGKIVRAIESNATADGFTISVELLRPESRGTVRLQNNNPFTPPLIDPNYLMAKKDVQTLIKGIRVAFSVLNSSPFKSLRARVSDKPYPACVQYKFRSDPYWECVLRHLAVGTGQSTSTCSMGLSTDNDTETVVDSALRVRGIINLRIADASVIPDSVSGDILATKIMVAEKAADLIRGHESVRWFRRLSQRVLEDMEKRT